MTFTIGEEKRWSESEIEHVEEIVADSQQKGLPIIPFAYPTFSVVNKKLEETKDIIRRNSAKDLKRAFNENRIKNQDIYNEEEEEPCEDKSLHSLVTTARRELEQHSSSPCTYVEMSLSEGAAPAPPSPGVGAVGRSLQDNYMRMMRTPVTRSLSQDPYMRMSQEPYMRMSEEDPYMRMTDASSPPKPEENDSYCSMTNHTLPKKSRRQSEEPVFHLDESPIRIPASSYSDKTFPMRKKKMNIFHRTPEAGERNRHILNGSLMKPFKKGNKHKDDYVYVDFEKQNYMDMAQSGSNKWKFLNFTSK